jgi:hypothetical protein
MKKARVFFASSEATGMLHPSGDGERTVIVLPLPETDEVRAFYIPILDSETYKTRVWDLFRAEALPLEDLPALRDRIIKKREELTRQKLAFDTETTETILEQIAIALAPPPRVRARTL